MGPGAPEVSFDWDEGNLTHLARHRINAAEAEQFFRNDPSIRGYEVVEGEDRWTAVGATDSARVLVLVFTVRGERIRPVTGWDADRRTKKAYYAEKGI